MSTTYTDTRQNYYQLHQDEIKAKRRKKYQENINKERSQALTRHYKNKERNNRISLKYYHNHAARINRNRRPLKVI